MIASHYFRIRQRLKGVVHGVLDLAVKTGSDAEALGQKSIINGLNDPILYTVYGEKKAGKSTFLNALFGSELCDVDGDGSGRSAAKGALVKSALTKNLPVKKTTESSVKWYLFKPESDAASKDEPEGEEAATLLPLLQREFRGDAFLKDFNAVDTPGSNDCSEEARMVIESLLPISDLVFWVFSVENPWAASTWEMLSRQGQEVLDKSVIILQQADRRQQVDIDVMLGHMNDLSDKRTGRTLPMFPVSAQKAYQVKSASSAKSAVSLERNGLELSGFVTLEADLLKMINESARRRELLAQVRDVTVATLQDIEATIEDRSKKLAGNEGFLRDIESEVDDSLQRHTSDFTENLANMRDVFARQAPEAMLFMKSKMSVMGSLKSIFVTGHFSKDIESGLVELVKDAVEKQVDADGDHLVSNCRSHWQTVQPRAKEQLTIDLDDFDASSEAFQKIRSEFSRRMGAAAEESVVGLRIRTGLDRQLAERLSSLKTYLYISLICLSAAGLTGYLGWFYYPYVSFMLIAISLGAMVAFGVNSNRSRQDMMLSFQEKLDDGRIPFADGLISDYKEGVHDFYAAYGGLLGDVRTHIVQAKQELQPNLEKWNDLFLELKGIEQDF